MWAGINLRDTTPICILEGKMNTPLYTDILGKALAPFLGMVFPDGHQFVQDNDPKHVSRHAQRFIEEKGISWWRVPAESPELNPIENLWHELKNSYEEK